MGRPFTNLKPLAWTAAVLALLGLSLSLFFMVRAIRDHNQHLVRTSFLFKEVTDAAFNFAGRPVQLINERPGAPGWTLLVRYGAQSLRLPVSIPGNPKLPGLAAHNDWLRVLRFVDGTGRTTAQVDADLNTGTLTERLVLVTRSPMPGADPGTWGAAWREGWAFDFYELRQDGTFARERLLWPKGRPTRLPKPTDMPMLQTGTWQMEAALALIPQASRPSSKFTQDSLDAMGWTLPVAAWSIMILLLSLGIALAPAGRPRA